MGTSAEFILFKNYNKRTYILYTIYIYNINYYNYYINTACAFMYDINYMCLLSIYLCIQ